MNYIVYIIKSQKTGKHYIGYTQDIEKRLKYHNSGKNRSTKKDKPWNLIYTEKFTDKSQALKREREIKSYKSGNSFKNLLQQAGIV